MNFYRVVPLAVWATILLALFGVVCWLALSGDHDMRVAVISFITGISAVPAANNAASSISSTLTRTESEPKTSES